MSLTNNMSSLPTPPFDLAVIAQDLPAGALIPELQARCRTASANTVVVAPPGTGKTTVVPPAIANVRPGKIVVTQPRRIAAKAAATRLAELSGTKLGELVGYSVRGDRKSSPATRVEFVTDGLLVRRMLQDPELTGISTVVLDEIHERSMDSDLVAAMCSEIALLRDDFTVVAMSATVEAQRWATHFDAEVLEVASQLHPLEVEWRPVRGHRTTERGLDRDFVAHVVRASVDAHGRAQTFMDGGRVLTFVPSARDTATIADAITAAGIPARPLHGGLPLAEQQAVLRNTADIAVIVATSIAESSLTVPSVRVVVDAGLSREPRLDASRGVPALVTVPASRAAATQRAGRAARLGPGLVIRCFDHTTWGAMPEHPLPEVATGDFTSAALTLATWHGSECNTEILPEQPPAPIRDAALAELAALGALTDGKLTPLGRALSDAPTHPRFGRALFLGGPRLGAKRAAELVAMISGDERAPAGDLAALLRQLQQGHARSAGRWRQDVRQFTSLAEQYAASFTDIVHGSTQSGRPTDPDTAIATVVALAYPERIARRRPNSDNAAPGTSGTNYLLASGVGARCDSTSLSQSEWLAIAELQGAGATPRIRAAAPIPQTLAVALGSDLITDSTQPIWHQQRLRARRTKQLGAIVLHEQHGALSPDLASEAVRQRIRTDGWSWLQWSESAEHLRRRLALLHRTFGAPWPDVTDSGLSARFDEWFLPEVELLAAGTPVTNIDCASALQRLLPWPEAVRLDELAPERLRVPSGSAIALDYPEVSADADAPPVLAAKLQECFGLVETPRILDGRVPVLCHLLSPARRPLAVTADLASFWAGPYAQVRAEMRGRYPKHPWPEDPLTATATRHTTKRSQRD